jgi:hypothetical protein
MKEKIINIITIDGKVSSRRITESYFKKNYNEIYLKLLEKYKELNISFNEILYLIVNDLISPPNCVICGNKVRFRKFSQGYSKYCSMGCIGKDKNIQTKRETTSINNFGEKYTLQSKDKRDRIKQTNLERYGVEFPQQLEHIKNKNKETNLKKYGVEHHLKLKSQQEKSKTTLFNNYGVDNPIKSEIIKNKIKKTNLEKYGVEHSASSELVKNKMKNTNLKKYGVEYPINCDVVKNKSIETNLEKYGVECYSMTQEFIDKVKKTKKDKYNDENYNNRNKSEETSMLKYGVNNPSKSTEVINKIQNTVNNNFKEKYSKLLFISPDDIIINDSFVVIKKYCKQHDDFEISKSLLYSRLIINKHENICIKCNPIAESSSILENELKNFIRSLNVNILENKTNILNKKQEIDIYLPDHNLALEFNGIYWHSDLFKPKNYHLNKTEQCEQQNIQLLQIFDDEWIYKKEIVKSIIRNKLNIIENKIFARKCNIKEIDNNICGEFLNENHIQGNVNSNIKIGLYYNNELMSVMTFEIARKGLGNAENNVNNYNLNRFCNKINTQIIGGASKLLNYFIKTYDPESIITYADRRYSKGTLYENLNFKKMHVNKPTFFYFNNNKNIRYHRFSYRKEILIKNGWYDKNKTIDEILLEHKIYKIYDCGTIKYQMNLR